MALKQKHIADRIATFNTEAERARDLFCKLVASGYTAPDNAEFATPLMQPDRRDIAQYIFFELAAKFESLARDLFVFEVRIRLADAPKRVRYIMGTVDNGTDGVFGWAQPKRLTSRAENLFGKVGFFAKLETQIGTVTYQRLALAITIRNHIAHSGTNAYRKALSSLHVPEKQRSGCGPGRLLIDYPATASDKDKWFHRFIGAYTGFAETAGKRVKVRP